MSEEIKLVDSFHRKFGFRRADKPALYKQTKEEEDALHDMVQTMQHSHELMRSRIETLKKPVSPYVSRIFLIHEELVELAEALHEGNIWKIMKEACDLGFVFFGFFVKFGLGKYYLPCFREVARENMTKTGKPGFKPAKGVGFVPADMEKVITELERKI